MQEVPPEVTDWCRRSAMAAQAAVGFGIEPVGRSPQFSE